MTLKPSSLGTTTQNYLGKSQFVADPNLNGLVDEFQIYNRALTATEVALLAAPPAPPTGLSAFAGDAQVTLNWTAAAGSHTGYDIKRAVTSGGPFTPVASGITETSFVDPGLTDGTTYYYSINTLNDVAASSDSAQVSALPLSVPSGLTAGSYNAAVTLSWSTAIGATSYKIKRAAASGGPYATIASGVTVPSYSNTTGTPGLTYYYVVSAVNSSGESPDSSQVAIIVAPATPTGLLAGSGDAAVTLTWTASAGANAYNILRSSSDGFGYSALAMGIASVGFSDASVVNGTTYFYVVSAANAGGESAWSAQAGARPSAPISFLERQSPLFSLAGEMAIVSVNASVIGHNYSLQFSDDLNAGFWQSFGPTQRGNGSNLQFNAPFAPSSPRRFYRIIIQR